MSDSSDNVDPRIDTTVAGKYRIVRLVGQGGMGRVYEAQHTQLGRRFAVKFLHAHHAQNEEVVKRFQREAEAAGGIENENIAAAIDVGVQGDGAPFLTMEFLVGEDLAHLLARGGPLPVSRAADIIVQTCRGLAAAHARGIVHRDLKPQNLFVCKRNDGTDLIKVLDFGIAKLQCEDTLTHTGATLGTPSYMSIEQARGAKDVDPRSDVYALGVILYETLAGARPHPGSSYNEVLYHVLTHEPPALESVRSGLPSQLIAVVDRAMAREPDERYQSVTELAAALAPFAERFPESASLPPAKKNGELATMASPASLPIVSVSSEIPKLAPLPKALWATAAGTLVVLLVTLGMWWKLGRESANPNAAISPAPLASVAPRVAVVPSDANDLPSPGTVPLGAAPSGPTGAQNAQPVARSHGRSGPETVDGGPRRASPGSPNAAANGQRPAALPFDRDNPYAH